MSLFNNDCGCNDAVGGVRDRDRDKCDSCACDQLRDLRTGDVVDIILDGEEFPNLVFACFDKKDCCVTFLDEDYPFIVDCRKIDAIRIVA
ncbi:hypothetical protein [Alkalihalobacillus sp. AL-G]|uniref:hypothetical protein n=1 Tax=Alkalihalobacillus sp. AL-G TaxID=2926399 RepID=UPI00272B2CE9|nr:hypothetical protein [Alkalihalobacillus sp. AL-G]WLD94947.1 hypothetical protein MOJ78_08725 [Alkalihalobacillus sp. AL-G]